MSDLIKVNIEGKKGSKKFEELTQSFRKQGFVFHKRVVNGDTVTETYVKEVEE